ncbi:MAG: adenosylcobinamide-GDP ribazoletransferase [Gemmatimonadota bacterium]
MTVAPGARPRGWQAAVGMFTVIPVRAAAVDRAAAGRAILWLPAVGLLLAAPAAAGLLAAEAGGAAAARRLLAAALAVAVLAVLTGGLHLDGLADTADGLASRRPPAEALAIMRRGDTGPLGVAALLFTVLLQVTALAALPPGIPAAAALATATVTARVAVVAATGPGFPAARPDGFGALVAGATPAAARVVTVAVLLAAVTAAGWLAGGLPAAWRGLAAAVAGLLAGALLCRTARARFGGLTGDVFGAVIEVTAAVTLTVLAVLS